MADEGIERLNMRLSDLLRQAQLPSGVWKEIGVRLSSAIVENFRQGGRPVKWLMSKRAQRESGQTLLRTGRLMKSTLTPELRENTLAFGSNLPYAAIHQYGFDGQQNVRAHTRRVESRSRFARVEKVNKKTGEIYEGRGKVAQGVAFVKAFKRHMRMPARPYIVFGEQDFSDVGRIAMRGLLR